MPPDSVRLLKLVWHPLDILADGRVKPTAFKKADLSGEAGAHVSVDREDMAGRLSMENVARGQSDRAKARQEAGGDDELLHEPMIACLVAGDVRIAEVSSVQAFGVGSYPVPGNDAHCGIENISGYRNPKTNRAFFDEARGRLAALSSPVISFDEAYPG